MAGVQRRPRLTIEVLSEAGHAAADMTYAEGRSVQADEVLSLAQNFGVRCMRACPTCRARMRCEIHGPPVGAPPPPAPKREGASASVRRYAEAYAAGQTDVSGQPFTPPLSPSDAWHLPRMATVHGRTPAGEALTGDALVAWFRGISAEYRRAKGGEPQFESGFVPRRCLAWLDSGRPTTSGKPVGTRQKAPKGQPSWKADEGVRFT